ncbi:MAG: hypothetical protein B0W54_22065 [Cellvibrio sp. 79]|nr:MAG: hypothetical protein B0W54_22065 [Cellvibrio sp. 79]
MIFKLRWDREKFLTFDISPDDIEYVLGDFFLLDEPLWSEFWKPLNATFFDDSDNGKAIKVPDITVWPGNACLALNAIALEKLNHYLKGYGELLPIESEGNPYWLFHSTKQTNLDLVDLEKSARTISETGYVEMQALTFNEKKCADELIFLSEFSDYRDMYCTEEFKQLVESNGLKGLYFSTDLACVNEP